MHDTYRLYTDLAWLWPLWGDATEEYADYCQHVTAQIHRYALNTESFVQNRTTVTPSARAGIEVVFVENVYDPDPTDEHYETTVLYLTDLPATFLRNALKLIEKPLIQINEVGMYCLIYY